MEHCYNDFHGKQQLEQQLASDRKNERIAEIIRQKDVIMKMLKERVRATGIILQDHELKYKAEKAWRAGIVNNNNNNMNDTRRCNPQEDKLPGRNTKSA